MEKTQVTFANVVNEIKVDFSSRYQIIQPNQQHTDACRCIEYQERDRKMELSNV